MPEQPIEVGTWGLWQIEGWPGSTGDILVAGTVVGDIAVGEWEVEGIAIALGPDDVLLEEDALGYRFAVNTTSAMWPLHPRHRPTIRARVGELAGNYHGGGGDV